MDKDEVAQIVGGKGGKHAQFGNCGNQDGDGIADISSDEQQHKTVEIISGQMEPMILFGRGL